MRKYRAWAAVTAYVVCVSALTTAAVLASFTASPVPWDGTFELQPANSDPVSQGAAHIRQVKGESSRRAGVDHAWGAFGNDTADTGRHLRGSSRIFLQSAAPSVTGATTALCQTEVDTAGNRHCGGGEMWLDTDDNQLYVALDAGADGDADTWQPVTPFGKRTIWVGAGGMAGLSGASPASPGLIAPGGAGTMGFNPLDFDPGTLERAQFSFFLPKSANAGTVTYRVIWTADAASTSSVVWRVGCASYADNVVIDDAPTFISVTDAHNGAAHEANRTAESGALTILNAAVENFVQCEVDRDAANGSDTLTVDARLIGVAMFYTTDKYNDN